VIRANVNVSFPWRLVVGDHVWIGEDVGILTLAPVTIESNVCISQRAYLCTGSHDFRREDFKLRVAPITVREGSWVAAASFIAPGVEVGPDSIVSAGSVVFENVAPKTLVRGNPAAVVSEFRGQRSEVTKTEGGGQSSNGRSRQSEARAHISYSEIRNDSAFLIMPPSIRPISAHF
jgi:acetyltransferase-like isoleucine patch superfamily enzyme